jgi:retron-type reverse transcriptase
MGELFQQFSSFANLYAAYRRARKGKRGKASVAGFEYNQEEELITLRDELASGTWRPGKYTNFYIHEPKKRLISAAPFRDRVVHHALCNLIEPIFERSFVSDSYANRIGKGTHRALDRAQGFARRFRYVLPFDVRQFFPSIDHAILRGILGRKIADSDTLWLVDQILESGVGVLSDEYEMVYFPGDDLFALDRPRGLPIGNLTSQFWANCYLNPFDHFVKRELRCRGYVRYVDDFLLFADSKTSLLEWRSKIIRRLGNLRLVLHEDSAQARPVAEGIPFLGFLVFPTHRRLKRRKGLAFQRKYRSLLSGCFEGKTSHVQITASVQGWVNHARYGNTWGLRRAILSSRH